jgi:hypothetical protein
VVAGLFIAGVLIAILTIPFFAGRHVRSGWLRVALLEAGTLPAAEE